jgi:predicted RNA-binding protein associated with RNAse of E/G family
MANVREIRSGELGRPAEGPDAVRDYRFERVGEALIERLIWGALSAPRTLAGVVIADAGYAWFRFWLPQHAQVIDRYYTAQGVLVGTKMDICMPLECDEQGCHTVDLLMDIWIRADGQVTIYDEDVFEDAVRVGTLSDMQIAHAEQHIRDLTGAIARGKFPPPIVRNWQVDPQRLGIARGPSSAAHEV